MEHKDSSERGGKLHKISEILGGTDGPVYIAEVIVILLVLIGTAVYIFLVKYLPDSSWLTGCQVKKLTGFICPGCGTTRAVLAMLRGDFGKALYYHAATVYLTCVCAVYFVSQSIRLATKGRTRAMHFHVAYVYVWLAVYVIQYVVKLQ